MQEKLAEAEFILDLFDALPDAITFLSPVFKDDKIVDFNITYVNATAAKFTGKIPVLMAGKNILEHKVPSVSSHRQVFDQSLEAYYSRDAITSSYYNAFISSEVTVTRYRYRNGVLTVSRSIKPIKA